MISFHASAPLLLLPDPVRAESFLDFFEGGSAIDKASGRADVPHRKHSTGAPFLSFKRRGSRLSCSPWRLVRWVDFRSIVVPKRNYTHFTRGGLISEVSTNVPLGPVATKGAIDQRDTSST
jgi:hypothetical protein